MPNYRLQLFGSDLPCIAEIDFMMQTLIRNIEDIPTALHILVHECDSGRLIVIRADVHTLDTQSLIIGKNSTLEKSCFFFFVAS